MEATTVQITWLILMTLGLLGASMTIYLWSLKNNKTSFYGYVMMIIVLVQLASDTGAALIFRNYYLHLASVLLFPSIIFSLFICYLLQGYRSVKQLMIILLIGEIGYVLLVLALWVLGNTPSYILFGWPWFSNHFFSTIALIVDFYILLSSWPVIHNQKYKIPLFIKIFLVFWILLVVDSLVFSLGTFWKNEALSKIISANLIIRSIISIILTPLITIYLTIIERKSGNEFAYRSWSDLTLDSQEQQQIINEAREKVLNLEKLESELKESNLNLQNQRKAIMNVLEDVQAEKLLVTKQADELRRFKIATEQSNEMIVFADANGIVEWGNKATETITGFTVEEAAGKKAGVLWGNLMSKDWYANLWKTVKTNKQTFTAEIQNHRKNGERYWSTITIYPLLNSTGEVQFLVATQRDITHEKEVDRMKTDFISLASHQLRTPLSAMKWFLEMLMAGDMGALNKEQKEAVDNIEQSNDRMIALVNGLLNISRIESGRIIVEPEPTDIVKLSEDVVKELDEKFKSKNQNIIISGNKEIPKIMLDSKLIRQVIMNILTNANKYTGDDGEIAIFISRKNEEVIIQISDNGYGIPASEQERIFHRFFRATNVTKKETDGTGLGLYLAKAIVESSGGKIWFKSKEGEGTTFWFTLPITGMQARAGEVRLS